MAGFSGATFGSVKTWSKEYTDSQIPLYLSSGATPKGSWNADTNIPTITQGSGSLGEYYDVIEAGEWDGISFLVGDRIIFTAKNKWERVPTGVESDAPIVIEYIDEYTTSFPTVRKSGNTLKIGDYVGVKSTAHLPFTVGSIIFDSFSDQAIWNGTQWQEKSYNVGKTNEVAVNNKTSESISGTASYQSEVNIENKTAITNLQKSLCVRL